MFGALPIKRLLVARLIIFRIQIDLPGIAERADCDGQERTPNPSQAVVASSVVRWRREQNTNVHLARSAVSDFPATT
jgi:hypothetical protein